MFLDGILINGFVNIRCVDEDNESGSHGHHQVDVKQEAVDHVSYVAPIIYDLNFLVISVEWYQVINRISLGTFSGILF